ncbi:MAG: hypothetical protein SGJ11_08715 [Phycisphaerae bacterium]|nr:hypothetical protein [Phycisphaerae bacterium]
MRQPANDRSPTLLIAVLLVVVAAAIIGTWYGTVRSLQMAAEVRSREVSAVPPPQSGPTDRAGPTPITPATEVDR